MHGERRVGAQRRCDGIALGCRERRRSVARAAEQRFDAGRIGVFRQQTRHRERARGVALHAPAKRRAMAFDGEHAIRNACAILRPREAPRAKKLADETIGGQRGIVHAFENVDDGLDAGCGCHDGTPSVARPTPRAAFPRKGGRLKKNSRL